MPVYGEKHPFSIETGPEKFIWGLSLFQLIAILVGGKLSYELSQVVPNLPIENIFFKHIHQGLPLIMVLILVCFQDNVVGRTLLFSLFDKIRARFRRRCFLYKREEA